MKRLLYFVLVLVVMLFPFMSVNAATKENKVKLYVFYGETCPHCKSLHEAIDELKEDKNYNYMFNVVYYEVWYDSANMQLMNDVATALDKEVQGVPFYVVWNYSHEGFPDVSTTKGEEALDELKSSIKTAYSAANSKNPTYKDIVASIGIGNADKTETEEETTEVIEEENENKSFMTEEEIQSLKRTLSIIGIVLVIVIGLAIAIWIIK